MDEAGAREVGVDGLWRHKIDLFEKVFAVSMQADPAGGLGQKRVCVRGAFYNCGVKGFGASQLLWLVATVGAVIFIIFKA